MARLETRYHRDTYVKFQVNLFALQGTTELNQLLIIDC